MDTCSSGRKHISIFDSELMPVAQYRVVRTLQLTSVINLTLTHDTICTVHNKYTSFCIHMSVCNDNRDEYSNYQCTDENNRTIENYKQTKHHWQYTNLTLALLHIHITDETTCNRNPNINNS